MKLKDSERKLYIPSKVNLPALILQKYDDRYLHDHQDKYAYILSKIIELKIFAKPKRNGLVSLSSRLLREVLGGNYYKKILSNLLEWNVIVTDNNYVVGEESKGYNISMAFSSKAIEILILKEQFAANLQKRKFKTDSKPANYILSQLKYIDIKPDALQYILLKYNATINLIDSLPENNLYNSFKQAATADHYSISGKHEDKYDTFFLNQPASLKAIVLDKYNSDFISINNILNRNYSFSVDPNTGRVYTFITNLSKSLRQFLYHKKYPNQSIVNIDIRNSQPFIFCSLLVDYYQTQLPEDVKDYISLCSSGQLYNELMDKMDYEGDRKSFKQLLFATLFYCKNGWANRSKDSLYFRKRFPNVYKVICHYKRENYKDLSRRMQTVEADIIINKVVKSLMRQSIFVTTIHDSILTFPANADNVMATIKKYFMKEYHIEPSLEVEPVTGREKDEEISQIAA